VSRSRRGFAPTGRLAAAVAVACLVPAVAACDAGNNAPTLEFHPQSAGIDTVVHGIKIDDAFVLGSATDSPLRSGESAGFYLALLNEGSPDRLVSVTAAGTASSVTLPAGGIALGTYQAVYLTGPKPKIVLTKLTHPLDSGSSVTITLNFLNAGSFTMTVPVLPRASEYATFAPAPVATPTATPSKTVTPTGTSTTTPGATTSATGPPATATATPSTSATG
jgi:copper(I)-binding protein